MFEVNIFETKITEIIFTGSTKYFRDGAFRMELCLYMFRRHLNILSLDCLVLKCYCTRLSLPVETFFYQICARVEIEEFGHSKKHTFCADDAPFYSGKPRNVIWKPKCRDNRPDPGNSILGALLNADPVGNAKFVFDQVNKSKPYEKMGKGGVSFIQKELSTMEG